MSAVAFCMDLILATLLLAALLVGMRLEKRLKALRESQAGFQGAVLELDAAIARAEHGLAELKTAALDAQTTVADRIQDAKGMTARLDKHAQAAGEAAQRLETLLERYAAMPVREFPPVRPRNMPQPAPQPAHPRDQQAEARGPQTGRPGVLSLQRRPAGAAEREEPLTLRREALSRPAPGQKDPGSGVRRDERTAMGSPRRASADDELFEIIEPAIRAARGMAR